MPVKKKTANRKPRFSKAALKETAEQYLHLKATKEELEKRFITVRDRLSGFVEEFGEEDDRGHIRLPLDNPIDGIGGFKRERRVQQPFDDEAAEKILRSAGLYDKATTRIVVLDESKIEQLHYNGDITEAQYDEMYPQKITWALRTEKS